jgi:hypothetical protein
MERRSGDPAEILVALELSKAAWLVAIYDATLEGFRVTTSAAVIRLL